uniref:Uncharacterized protein n=1 Tax=Salmo trutta TaxID=8032 RepID=A0A673XNL4_SALTR
MFGFTQENAEKTVTNVKSDTLSSDFSKQAQISDTPSSTNLISAGNEQNLPECAVISATKHHIVSNETSKVSSIQHQTSISSTKQQPVTAAKQQVLSAYTEQSHFAVSSSQVQISTSDAKKFENTKADVKNLKMNSQVQISTSDAKKVENMKKDVRKDVKNLKTKSQVQISTSDDKKGENTKKDVRKDVKNLKTTSQVQISTSDAKKGENTKRDVMKDVKNLKTTSQVQISTSDAKKVEDTKKDVMKDVKNHKTNSQVQISTSDYKKVENMKRNVKNLKTNSQVQISTSDDKKVEDTKKDVMKDVKKLKTTSQVQISTMIITESKVHQSVQEQGTVKVEKQVKASQKKKEVTANQQIQEKPKEEYRNVPDSQRREHVQKLISHITELEGATGQVDSKSVKTLLNTIPEWLIGPEETIYLEGTAVEHNIQTLTEIVSNVKKLAKAKLMCLEGTHTTLEKHESKPTSEKIIVGGATQKIRKISVGSSKVECQKKVVESKKTSHESKKQELSVKSIDRSAPSPLLRMRSPSPTFITIESTQRTDSPRRITPSPIPTLRPATPPTPPPRKFEPPTSHINRATPSPTFPRAENLAWIKDTTAQLSCGVTPPPDPLPMQVTENKSDIVEPPASFYRQIKIEQQTEETSEMLAKTIVTAKKHKKELYEEAQKAAVKTYVRKDPIDIPERLGPDMEEPKTSNQDSKDETQSTSEKITENSTEVVGSTESTDKELMEASEMSESSIVTTSVRDKREFFEEAQKAETNKTYQENTQETQRGSGQISPLPSQKEVQQTSADPTDSETKLVTEHFLNLGELGNKTIGSLSSTTVSQHSKSVPTHRPPFSYADVVKKKGSQVTPSETPDEASTEELLRNFHKTWTESESFFKSLGYSVSEERTSHVVSHQTKTVVTGSNSGQKKIP